MDRLTFHLPTWLPWLAGALPVAALAALWWYRAQARALQLSRGAGTLVVSLRLLAIVILGLALLRPSLPHAASPNDAAPLIVLIDRSRSMGVRDSGRPAGNVDLVEALGMVGGRGATDPASGGGDALRPAMSHLRDAQQAVAVALSELDYARLSGRPTATAEARLRAAADGLRAANDEMAALAAALPGANVLRDRCSELARHVDALGQATSLTSSGGSSSAAPSGSAWLRQAWDLVNRVGADVEHVRSTTAEQRLREDEAVREACEQLARESRLQLALRALTGPGGFLAQLDPAAPVHLFTFADAVAPLPAPFTGDVPAQGSAPLVADGANTDLHGAVREVRRSFADRDVRAIVVFSDGRQTGSTARAAPGGVPVFAVQCARGSPRDVAVTRLELPPSAAVGETVPVRVDVRAGGNPRPNAVEVELDTGVDGQRLVRPVDLGNDERGSVEFALDLTGAAGARRIVATVKAEADELTTDNNRAEGWLKVTDTRLRVALLSGSAGWEYQYVRAALARWPWVKLSEQLILDGESPQTWQIAPEEVAVQDAFIVIDAPPRAVSAGQWDAMKRAVEQHGAGAILVAGDEHLPREWQPDARAAAFLPFAPSAPDLPYWKVWPGASAGYFAAPAANLDESDARAVQLNDDRAASARRWDELPGLWRYLTIDRRALKPAAHALLVERGSGDPLLVEQRLGLGRVLFLAADETWRWRYKGGERDHDRFWTQLLHRAAAEPYALELPTPGDARRTIGFDVDRIELAPGEVTRVRARLPGVLPGASPPRVELRRDDRVVHTMTLRRIDPAAPSSDAEGHFEVELQAPPALGDYEVRLSLDDSHPIDGAVLPMFVRADGSSGSTEMADVSGDDGDLRRLVAGTGGEVIRLDQVSTLPERIARARAIAAATASVRSPSAAGDAAVEPRARANEYRLWDSPYLYMLVVGLLGIEWAVRKRIGLA